ncbi:ROK family transcriptional regulator [Deinococcus misasensis]|uniref:ROK family transcriptional regulator n=1 Tax=Deinococcus misasensis TaxID=392413 RepID=UPI0005514506|nr:ROK family transcriptional regulator [Deinococcus misasensis]
MSSTPSSSETSRAHRGSNHEGMRAFNERTLLHTIRLHPGLSKADLARLTRLSTQTVSGMVDVLFQEGLLLKGEPVKGRVGQPSVPLTLNPEGAFSIGVHLGREQLEVYMVDFAGQVRHQFRLMYTHPDPALVFPVIEGQVQECKRMLSPEQQTRLSGIGLAAPLNLADWEEFWTATSGNRQVWNDIQLREHLQSLTGLPTTFLRDTAAACIAELMFGAEKTATDFLYIYLGTFIGGALVLKGELRSGLTGRAGSVGSFPVQHEGKTQQLLDVASLWPLEDVFKKAGLDPLAVYDERALEPPFQPYTEQWVQDAVRHLSTLTLASAALLDLQGLVLDGECSPQLIERVQVRLQAWLQEQDTEGLHMPVLSRGTLGSKARALGAAMLPLYQNFSPLDELFLK